MEQAECDKLTRALNSAKPYPITDVRAKYLTWYVRELIKALKLKISYTPDSEEYPRMAGYKIYNQANGKTYRGATKDSPQPRLIAFILPEQAAIYHLTQINDHRPRFQFNPRDSMLKNRIKEYDNESKQSHAAREFLLPWQRKMIKNSGVNCDWRP